MKTVYYVEDITTETADALKKAHYIEDFKKAITDAQ